MKRYAVLAALMMSANGVFASKSAQDTVKNISVNEVQVIATRATNTTPIAHTDVSKEEIQNRNYGQDIPFILSSTPSVLTTSDAGNGIGYTSIRVRGTDGTRINISSNGIPMNDAESCSLFWVNTPDFASSLKGIQIQRGAGTSTNGSGAFGASIDMETEISGLKPLAEVNISYGSYNTQKETIKLGTGLLGNHWYFDGRLSNIMSDGYRDRASADLKSYFLQGAYLSSRTTLKFITFGGQEKTYHAWDGLDKETLESNRKYNPNGEIKDENGNIVGFYDNQIDKYKQTHYQLLLKQIISSSWRANVGLHYTDGHGYYEEYKNKRNLIEYGIEGDKSDLVRRKIVSSDFGGVVFSFENSGDKFNTVIGGGYNQYVNQHSGRVIWVKDNNGVAPDHLYYKNKSHKYDGNIYAKTTWSVGRGVAIYADMQYRYVHYTIDGVSDKWDWRTDQGKLQELNVDDKFNFFNPKAGINWDIDTKNRLYASVAVAHKEPTRNNYTDNLQNQTPKAERLIDYEAGYTFQNRVFNFGANFYYMDYKDQLVLNGQVNEIGEMVSENVENSFRTGVELSAGAKITNWLYWDANATLSSNKIKGYTEYLSDVNQDWEEIYTTDGTLSQTTQYKEKSTIAFSPTTIFNNTFNINYKGLNIALHTQYVSKQYLNNGEHSDCTLDAYCVNNLNVNYTIKPKGIKSIKFGVAIYNLFNTKYETNGYASGYAVYEGDKLSYTSNYAAYYPAAGINALGHISFNF
ncbi:MAG: TonB-dependent receptor [Bacteroidales bacterium]|nr:TonB-dependent receptor [Bacteroidales bacterium]